MEKIGLALSGGGVKSISQLPIVNILNEEGIEISFVAGTSMGSVIAALVSLGLDNETLNKTILDLEEEIQVKRIFSRPSTKILPFMKDKIQGGFVDGADLERVFEDAIKDYDMLQITDVKIPLAIPAVDVITGKIVVFVSHPHLFKATSPDWVIRSDVSLAQAVRASCSFPFVIASWTLDDMILVDGGVRMNLPAPLVKAYGAEKTISVTMNTDDDNFQDIHSWTSYAMRILDLMRLETDVVTLSKEDLNINIPLNHINVFDVGKGRETIERGEAVVKEHSDAIRALKAVENVSWLDEIRNYLSSNLWRDKK